jgi:hypothetical protein
LEGQQYEARGDTNKEDAIIRLADTVVQPLSDERKAKTNLRGIKQQDEGSTRPCSGDQSHERICHRHDSVSNSQRRTRRSTDTRPSGCLQDRHRFAADEKHWFRYDPCFWLTQWC